jgi:hypothetical protein
MALVSILRMIFGQRPASPSVPAADAPGVVFVSDEVLFPSAISDEEIAMVSVSDE